MPWREQNDLIMDGGTLVDLSTGYRYQTVNSCGSSGHATSSACTYLSLARSLFGLSILKSATDERLQTASKAVRAIRLEVKVAVGCRACNARESYSEGGFPLWTPLWLSKNLARSVVGGTSITWEITQRLDDQPTKSAFGAWARSGRNWLEEASRLAGTGNATRDT